MNTSLDSDRYKVWNAIALIDSENFPNEDDLQDESFLKFQWNNHFIISFAVVAVIVTGFFLNKFLIVQGIYWFTSKPKASNQKGK